MKRISITYSNVFMVRRKRRNMLLSLSLEYIMVIISNYETASVEYAKIEHYFGLFYQEKCVLIINVNTDYVMNTLNANYEAYIKKGSGTTNLNTVKQKQLLIQTFTLLYTKTRSSMIHNVDWRSI